MNNWWLKLYTLPHFLSMAKKIGIVTLISLLAAIFWKDAYFMTLLLYIYPAYTYFTSNDDTLLTNIDFHKMNVPFKELRRAVFLDMMIHYLSFMLMMVVGLYIPMAWLGQGHELWDSINGIFFGTPSYAILSITGFSLFMFTVKFSKLVKGMNKQIKQSNQKIPLMQKILIVPGVIVGVFFGPRIEHFIGQFNDLTITCAMFFTICTFGQYFFFRTKFHQEKSVINGKRFTIMSATVLGIVAAFFGFVGLLSRFEMNSKFYSAESRAKTMFFLSDFSPELEVDTAADLMAAMYDTTPYVMKHVHPEIYQIPINQIYDKRNLFVWYHYLASGKPSEQNLVYMMRELKEHPEASDWLEAHYYHMVNVKLVKHWPAAKELPKDLIPKKIKRSIASKKKGP